MPTEEEKAEMMRKMDEAAVIADRDLRALSQKSTIVMAQWFLGHYQKAGHKRLGRIIVSFAKETKDIKPENFE